MRTTVLSAAVFGTFFFAATAGAQWVKTTGPWSGELFSLVSGSGGLVAGTAGVVSFSADNGATWTDRFVCENGDTASGFNALAVSGASIFAGCNGDGVFVSSNNGASWSSFNTGLTDKNIFGLLVSGTRLYAATGSGVFVTQNTTANWSGGLTGLPVRRFNCFTVSGSNVFAGSFQRGIFVSSSNGLTWTAVNTGLSSLNSQSIWSMASAGGKVYAGTLDGVYVSTDQGGQWTAMNDGLTNTIVGALAVSDTMIFAGTDAGVFACNRGGTTWRYIHDSRMDSVVYALTVGNGYLFATSGAFVWKYPLPGAIGVHGRSEPGRVLQNGLIQQIGVDPHRRAATVTFSLSQPADVRITIHDGLGREIARVASGSYRAGGHTAVWEARSLAGGLYLCRLKAGAQQETKTLVVRN